MKIVDTIKISVRNLKSYHRKYFSSIILICLTLLIFNLSVVFFDNLINKLDSSVESNNYLKLIKVTNTSKEKLDIKSRDKFINIANVIDAFPKFTLPAGILLETNAYPAGIIGITNKSVSSITGTDFQFSDNNGIIVSDLLKNDISKTSFPNKAKISYSSPNSDLNNIRSTKDIDLNILGYYKQIGITDVFGNVNYISLDLATELYAEMSGFQKNQSRDDLSINEYYIIVDDVSKVSIVADEIQSKGYNVEYALQYAQNIPGIAFAVGVVGIILTILFGLFSLILLNNNTNSNLHERLHSFGILKSLNFTTFEIYNIIILELIQIITLAGIISYITLVGILYILPNFGNLFLNTSNKISIADLNLIIFIYSFLIILIFSLGSTARISLKISSSKVVDLLNN